MERLTEVENGTAMVKGCGSNCKYGFEYCRKEDWENCKTIDDVIDKLAQYETLEEQGLLLRLPCKVGDTVYAVTRDFISEYTICSIEVYNEGLFFNWKCEKGMYINIRGFTNYQIGKDVFLTQEEAEAKLKELRCNHD